MEKSEKAVQRSPGTYVIAIVGDGAVGKTAITLQLVQSNFVTDYDPTIESSYKKSLQIGAEQATLDILDTAGQEEYGVLREHYFRSGDGFIVVYSVTDRSSFMSVPDTFSRICRVKEVPAADASTSGRLPVIIVANKVDLVDKRDVTRTEGEQLASRLGGGVPYLEVSAKKRLNIEETFIAVVEEIRRCKKTASERAVQRHAAPIQSSPASAAAASTPLNPKPSDQDKPAGKKCCVIL